MNIASQPGRLFEKSHWTREELIAASEAFLEGPDLDIESRIDVVTVEAGGMEWDIAGAIYEPVNQGDRMLDVDGLPIGFFLIHGGEGDYRSMDRLARLLARRCGARVVSMTYPGRFYFDDPNHDWPGDTIRADGSVRTPIWKRDEVIEREEYDIVSDPSNRYVYGTRTMARARPGTNFYRRMAGWPLAMEEGALALFAKYFPVGEWSVFVHGHSTGGPVSHYLLQRIENIRGLTGIENSQFGYIWAKMNGVPWPNGFNDLVIRTWRDHARYRGAEVLKSRGAEALMALPALMEDVLESWDGAKVKPQFKAEYILHVNCARELESAARVTAQAMKLGGDETEALVGRYLQYGFPLSGADARPIPPIIYIVCAHSRDHTYERYSEIAVPMMEAITPKPKVKLITFGTGSHSYARPEEDLPEGLCPPAIAIWCDAIRAGYYAKN